MTRAARDPRTRPLGSVPTLLGKIDGADAADRKAARGAGAGRIP